MSELRIPIPLARDLTISSEAKILYAKMMAGESVGTDNAEKVIKLTNELVRSGWAENLPVYRERKKYEVPSQMWSVEFFCPIKEE